MPILYLPIPVSQYVLNTEDMVLFLLNCLKDHWIPWINLIKERHEESRNVWRKKRKERREMEEKKGRREEEKGEREREKEFSTSSNIYEFTVT